VQIFLKTLKKGTIIGKHGFNIYVTMTLNEVDPKKYDILILPGGKGPSMIRKEQKALEIARYFFDQNKLVAAICHGPQILISAGLLEGRVATGYKSIAINAFMEAIKEYLYFESKK